MEDMDADLVLNIPDTPDRLPVKRVNGGLIASHLRSHDPRDEAHLESRRSKCRLVTENGQNRKVHIRPRRDSGNLDQLECSNNVIVLSPSKNSHASQNASLFRRSAMDRNSKHETKTSSRAQHTKHETQNSARVQHMDKGKAICSELPSRSVGCSEGDGVLDLTKLNEHQMFERAFSRCVPFGVPSEQRKKDHEPLNCGSYLHVPRPSVSPGNVFKSKGKIGEGLCSAVGISSDSPHKVEKQPSSSHISRASPRVGRKRLVRNGCISPHNIEMRTKQVIGHKHDSSKEVQQSHPGEGVSNGPSSKDIREIVADDTISGQPKTNNSQIFPEPGVNPIHLSSSPQLNEEDGWRSTCNRLNDVADYHVQQHINDRVVNRDSRIGRNAVVLSGSSSQNAPQTASISVSNSRPKNVLSKRKKRNELGLRCHGEGSRVVPDDSDVIVLTSPGEASSSRSCGIHSHQESGSEPSKSRLGESPTVGCVNITNSEERARQLEADEMMARELQEQLYHEAPIFDDDVTGENIEWALQHDEEALRTSLQAHNLPNPRNSRRRQQQLRSFQNPLTRRRIRSRTTTRMSQLRSEVLNQSRAAFHRTRNVPFPLGMDLEMRLNILEMLEAAMGDLGETGFSNHMFQRDFNENDYEMLLALDENNNRHGGASATQINSLPESTVQTANFGEDCAICLETPGVGETIRHLPCLHKFHKACIDPWLSRKTSCPVCKSSIT